MKIKLNAGIVVELEYNSSIQERVRGRKVMNSTAIELHPKLAEIMSFAPILKSLYSNDVAILISDKEKVVYQLESKELDFGNALGQKLTPKDPMYTAIQGNKKLKLDIPTEVYGIPFRIRVTPISGDRGEVIGSIGVSISLNKQFNLAKVAEQLAASSEEIAASTEELSFSATTFMKHMNELTEAQRELTKQVESSTKILEMINTVAKSTRILGFNAGIEAARSGEHGKGFSVVAKEITKLADQSAESVNEIHKLLDLMKDRVDQVATTVNLTVDVSKNQSTSINEISQAIQHLTVVAENVEDLVKKV